MFLLKNSLSFSPSPVKFLWNISNFLSKFQFSLEYQKFLQLNFKFLQLNFFEKVLLIFFLSYLSYPELHTRILYQGPLIFVTSLMAFPARCGKNLPTLGLKHNLTLVFANRILYKHIKND